MKTLDKIPVISYTLALNMLSILFMPDSIPISVYLTRAFIPWNAFRGDGWLGYGVIGALFGFFAIPYLIAFFIIFLIDACRKKMPPKTKETCTRVLEYFFRTLAILFAATLIFFTFAVMAAPL